MKPRTVGHEQARTAQARAAVIAAATELFEVRGYAATPIGMISAESGVPEATLYRLFGGKLGILTAAMDVAIAGDDEPVPVASRPVAQAAVAEPSPQSRVAQFVAIMVDVNVRIGRLYWVVFRAAHSDPGARDLLESLDTQRARGQGMLTASLHEDGALRPGLSPDEARDIVHAVMSPETYRLLVTDRGWTTERYQQWLTETITAQLLG